MCTLYFSIYSQALHHHQGDQSLQPLRWYQWVLVVQQVPWNRAVQLNPISIDNVVT